MISFLKGLVWFLLGAASAMYALSLYVRITHLCGS